LKRYFGGLERADRNAGIDAQRIVRIVRIVRGEPLQVVPVLLP
jgi:hypothetical protein